MANNNLVPSKKENIFKRIANKIKTFFNASNEQQEANNEIIENLIIIVGDKEFKIKFVPKNRIKDYIQNIENNTLDLNKLSLDSQIAIINKAIGIEADRICCIYADDFIGHNEERRKKHNRIFSRVNTTISFVKFANKRGFDVQNGEPERLHDMSIKTLEELQAYEKEAAEEMDREALAQVFPYKIPVARGYYTGIPINPEEAEKRRKAKENDEQTR